MENTYEAYKPRGHMRSASLENANALISKNTLGVPIISPGFTGTLKSRNEQKRLRSKFGSHNNLDDYAGKSKTKFQNLRNMFEMKIDCDANSQKHSMEFNENLNIVESENRLQSNNCQQSLDQAKNLLRPIAFKPIPFEPDYSIPNRYNDLCDRYGSTPSLVPPQGPNMKFGSTSDLRYGYNNYCSSYLARRRCSRSLKINDSMESIRHTPDSDAISQNSTMKSTNKFLPDQFDMTPSPSDSGISELEAALKDRDSELSYLRQTMEHNEKVIFKVHKDKEVYWEQETRRLKAFYESQQREHLLKIKKLEQMITLQSFQFKQNKLRLSEDSTRLKEQFTDLKNENDLLRNESDGLKQTERTMRDRVNQLEEKISVMDKLILNLKSQLEENEWTVCQKNGEIALLKTQLKEAKVELTLKEHELVHIKTEIHGKTYSHYDTTNCSEMAKDHSTKLETSQLNRIILLKDQVILALTNELSKLRKELSDLAIFHEYGEEPTGKYARLKYKIDTLSNICNENTKENEKYEKHEIYQTVNVKKGFDESNLEIIINCLKATDPFLDADQKDDEPKNNEISNDCKKFHDNKSNIPNLPDVTQSSLKTACSSIEQTPKTETLIRELEEVRRMFEIEKRQWAEEKEKVLKYQRQLQMHYINMYQRMKQLENKLA